MKNYIQELLYEHNSVIIPAFGGFTSGYKPASVDHVQGVIYPPSKDIKFNRYLTLNDGILVQHICDQKGWTREETEQAIRDWVAEMKANLDNREMLEFPRVGRLYLDFEGNFQFLQDSTNYNRDSFGLPSVGFYPVTRQRQVPKQEAPRPRQVSEAVVLNLTGRTSRSKVISGWFQRNVPYIVAASFLILAGTFFLIDRDSPTNQSGLAPFIKPVSEERINIKPQREEDATNIAAEDMIDRTQSDKPLAEENPMTERESTISAEDLDTEGATALPGQQEAVVIIGSFGNKKNVERLVKKVYSKGYEAFTVNDGRLTKVGVRFAYDNLREVENTRSRVAEDFAVKAWVLQPEMPK